MLIDDLFWILVALLIVAALWVFIRAPRRWVVRDWYAGMVADPDWQNPGYEGMLYFLTGAEYDKQFPNGTQK